MSPIKIERETKRVEIDTSELKRSKFIPHAVVYRDKVLLQAQQENPEWSIDTDGVITSQRLFDRAVEVFLVPMLRFVPVSDP